MDKIDVEVVLSHIEGFKKERFFDIYILGDVIYDVSEKDISRIVKGWFKSLKEETGEEYDYNIEGLDYE